VWTFTSGDMHHTCSNATSPEKIAGRRKRGVTTSVLMAQSELLHGSVKLIGAAGTPKPIKDVLDKELMTEISLWQARQISCSSGDFEIAMELLEYTMLPDTIARLKKEDPRGCYVLEASKAKWSDQCFHRCFISPSTVHRYGQIDPGLVVSFDACHRRTHIGGVYYLFVYRDAGGKLCLLAFGISQGESGDDAAFMWTHFRECFPNLQLVVQDEGSAINSVRALEALSGLTPSMRETADRRGVTAVENVFVGLCAKHLEKSVKQKHKKAGAASLLHRFAKARTEWEVAKVLSEASGISTDLEKDFRRLKPRLCLSDRLDVGVASAGITTNSNAESLNNSIQEARGMGVLSGLRFLLCWMKEKHAELHDLYNCGPGDLTKEEWISMPVERAFKIFKEELLKANELQVTFWAKGPKDVVGEWVLEGQVSSRINSEPPPCLFKVAYDVDAGAEMPSRDVSPLIQCSCRLYQDVGVACRHVLRGLIDACKVISNANFTKERKMSILRLFNFESARLMVSPHLRVQACQSQYDGKFSFESFWIPHDATSVDPVQEIKKMEFKVPMFPPMHRPRAQYATGNNLKKKLKHRRVRGFDESAGVSARRKMVKETSDACFLDEESFKEQDLVDVLRELHQHDGDSGSMIRYEEVAGKRKRKQKVCSRCLGRDHTRPTCKSGDILPLLVRVGMVAASTINAEDDDALSGSDEGGIDEDKIAVENVREPVLVALVSDSAPEQVDEEVAARSGSYGTKRKVLVKTQPPAVVALKSRARSQSNSVSDVCCKVLSEVLSLGQRGKDSIVVTRVRDRLNEMGESVPSEKTIHTLLRQVGWYNPSACCWEPIAKKPEDYVPRGNWTKNQAKKLARRAKKKSRGKTAKLEPTQKRLKSMHATESGAAKPTQVQKEEHLISGEEKGDDWDEHVVFATSELRGNDLLTAISEISAANEWLCDTTINIVINWAMSYIVGDFTGNAALDDIFVEDAAFFGNFIVQKHRLDRLKEMTIRRCKGRETVLIPAHVNGNHWVLLHLDLKGGNVSVFDSLSSSKSCFGRHEKTYLKRLKHVYGTVSDVEWAIDYPDCPKQPDSASCGVYTICAALQLMVGQPVLSGPLGNSVNVAFIEEFRMVISTDLIKGTDPKTTPNFHWMGVVWKGHKH